MLRILGVLCIVVWLPNLHAEGYKIQELWRGSFEQLAPMPWSGPMELYLRYDSGRGDPRPVEGVITWENLGNAKVGIEGSKNGLSLTFKESKCLQGGCNQILMGGNYKGTFDESYNELTGDAALEAYGLKGRFKLRRVLVPE